VRVRRPPAVRAWALDWLWALCWVVGVVLILSGDLVRGWICMGLTVATIAERWFDDGED
jgi:hypothetical protein